MRSHMPRISFQLFAFKLLMDPQSNTVSFWDLSLIIFKTEEMILTSFLPQQYFMLINEISLIKYFLNETTEP